MAQWTPSPPGRAFCMLPPRQCLPSQGRSIVEPAPFSAWESFYVIIGSSAAALTGLQFVVVVLGAEARSIGPEVGAFGTPTVIHYALLQAFTDDATLGRVNDELTARGYRTHEFGDSVLIERNAGV